MRQFSPFSFLLRKPCFALNQLYIELKTKSLLTKPSNVWPFHLVFSSSQNSNIDNICWILTRFHQGLFKSLGLYEALHVASLTWFWYKFYFYFSTLISAAEIEQLIHYEKLDEGQFYAGAFRTGRFTCTVCDKITYKKIDMSRHVQAIHLNHEYPCNICGRNYRTKVARYTHIKQKHQYGTQW